jgi:hypothetical protein
MDTLSRRSRLRRMPAGKRLMVTDRDLAIFGALVRYRYLNSVYLHAFSGGASETRFKERLGDLFHEGYLNRPDKQWEFSGARYAPAIYTLGARARRVLSERAEQSAGPSRTEGRQFLHALLICNCLASIELAAMRNGVRFIAWPEILARHRGDKPETRIMASLATPHGAVIPDGVFGLEYSTDGRKAYRFFALEADRAQMPITRMTKAQSCYAQKLVAYAAALRQASFRDGWGVPNLLVMTVTTQTARCETLRHALTADAMAPAFLFRAVEEAALRRPDCSLLEAPWLRGNDLSSLSIATP